MDCFDKFNKEISPGYTEEERAFFYLYYHLRKYPKEKTASIKRIRKYFRQAGRRPPDEKRLRKAFNQDRRFFPGAKPDTFGLHEGHRRWFDGKFGSCFDSVCLAQGVGAKVRLFQCSHPLRFCVPVVVAVVLIVVGLILCQRDHPVWFWVMVAGAAASIVMLLWGLLGSHS